METKKMNLGMLAGLVLIANFALAAFASLEKDVITADAIRALTKSSNKFPADAINAVVKSKTLVSKIELEEAFQLQDANGVTALGIPCGESCVWIPCFSSVIGCRCRSKVCYR